MVRKNQRQELGKIANRILAPYWGRGEYPILSPRRLRRIKRREILAGVSPQVVMDFARRGQSSEIDDV
jgi:hypothetical protein